MPLSPTHTELPTGEQWAIAHGRQHLVVTEVGSTLRSYSVAGEPVVDGFSERDWSRGGRGQVLAPWPNRLGDGCYRFGEHQGRAAWDEPERRNAIHGLARWLPWRLFSKAQNVMVTGCTLRPTPAYPFTVGMRLEYRLGRDGLTVTATASNLGEEAAPFGLGFHPYLSVGPGPVDGWRLHLPATTWLPTDERGLPTGAVEQVAGTHLDFTAGRMIGPAELDTAFGGLVRGADGSATVRLTTASGSRALELWVDEGFGYLMCFTADTLPEEERRRSLAVEPMSCPPDAFRSGTDLRVLEPGSSWQAQWGLRPE